MNNYIAPIILLTISNIFMTFAWYGHLKHKAAPLIMVILISWGIAFFEYCFQVPANRIGHEVYNAAQLKTIQEVITLIVFSIFSVLYLKEQFKWNYLVGFAFIILAVFFIFKKWQKSDSFLLAGDGALLHRRRATRAVRGRILVQVEPCLLRQQSNKLG